MRQVGRYEHRQTLNSHYGGDSNTTIALNDASEHQAPEGYHPNKRNIISTINLGIYTLERL